MGRSQPLPSHRQTGGIGRPWRRCSPTQNSKEPHFDGIVAWTQTRQTNGFIEALNGLFQATKRKARGYTRFSTMRTVLFLIAGKIDFTRINPHAA